MSLEVFLALCDVDFDCIHFYEFSWLEGNVYSYNFIVEHYVLADCYVKSFRIDAFGDLCVLFFEDEL